MSLRRNLWIVGAGFPLRDGIGPVLRGASVPSLPVSPRVVGHSHCLHTWRQVQHRARARFFVCLQVLHHMDGAFEGGHTLSSVPVKRLSQPWQVQLSPCESHGFLRVSWSLLGTVIDLTWVASCIVSRWGFLLGGMLHSFRVRWRVPVVGTSGPAHWQWCHVWWQCSQVAVATLLVHLHPGHHLCGALPFVAGLSVVVKDRLQLTQSQALQPCR